MNDDYLWDKSGEPDPQIQELEEILAPLRYEPKPLIIPVTPPKRNYLPLLAIAAAVLIAILAGTVWLRLRTEEPVPPQQQAQSEPSVYKEPATPEVVKNTIEPPKKVIRKRNIIRNREREEALAAKEQLMVALRLASEKLRSAQRRTQGASPSQIKNQHKIG